MIGYHPEAQRRIASAVAAAVPLLDGSVASMEQHEKLGSLMTVLPIVAVLILVWTFQYFRKDLFHIQSVAYIVLVSFSFAATSISMHTLNKVCVSLTGAPSTLTTIQMAITVVMTLAMQGREVLQADRKKLMYWCVVPVVYAGMLNSSLLGYKYLSLSLVTVFRNLSPMVTMTVENFFMAPEHRQKVTTPIVLSLLMMIVGAVVFSTGEAGTTRIGLCIVIVNTLLSIGDRVLQRRLLVSECKDLPLSACMTLNNSLGMLPTFMMAIAMHEVPGYTAHHTAWTDPSTLVLVALSGCMGMGIGFYGLMCQRAMTATSFQVLQNSAKVFVVAVGVHVFGDRIDGATRGVGMALSLLGSLAYGLAKAMDAKATDAEAGAAKGEREALLGDRGRFAFLRPFSPSEAFAKFKGPTSRPSSEIIIA